jgi:hypothetical protein
MGRTPVVMVINKSSKIKVEKKLKAKPKLKRRRGA